MKRLTVTVTQLAGWLPGNKSLPALPYEAGLIWYPDEDIHDLQVRIEVMLFSSLASRDLLKSAMDQIWQTLNHARRTGQWARAPSIGPDSQGQSQQVRTHKGGFGTLRAGRGGF